MKLFGRLTDDEEWEIDAQLSITGSIVSANQVGDIPADGWPKEFHPEVAERILNYLVDIEEVI